MAPNVLKAMIKNKAVASGKYVPFWLLELSRFSAFPP